jgi:hypothetical protein
MNMHTLICITCYQFLFMVWNSQGTFILHSRHSMLCLFCVQAAAAAKGIAELQQTVVDAVPGGDFGEADALTEESKEVDTAPSGEIAEEDLRRKAALQKLEGASQDSFLGQVNAELNSVTSICLLSFLLILYTM